jgi:hypothetical protein
VPDEAVDEERPGPVVDLGGGRELLHAAAVHDGDAVRHGQRLFLVVRDQHRGDAVVPLQPLDLDLHVEAEILVERAEGLVEQEDLRIHRERAGERDALLLPAGKLPRQPLGESLHMDEAQHVGHALADPRLRRMARLEPVGDVLGDRHMRKERVVLEHDADAAAMRRQMVHGLAVEEDAARALRHEARDDAQKRGLAAARGAQQRDELAGGDVEPDVADRDQVAEAVRDAVERHLVPVLRHQLPQ